MRDLEDLGTLREFWLIDNLDMLMILMVAIASVLDGLIYMLWSQRDV